MDSVSNWRSRIVGSDDVGPEELLANPRNWRIHPKAQQDALAGALDQVGWVQRVIVNRQTGHLVDGHLRVELALRRNEPSVPVEYVDLTPEEEGLVLASLDPLSAMATQDDEKLRQLLAEVSFDSQDLAQSLADLLPPVSRDLPDADDIPDLEEATYVRSGDLWVLGEHRLLCGDATSPEDVARLLAGARPALTVTDPPYGVEYDPEWRQTEGLSHIAKRGKVTNDDRADWRDAWSLSPSTIFYIWHDFLQPEATIEALRSCGIEPRMHIVWAKDRPVISRGHYNLQHEACYYAVRKGATADWIGGYDQSSVWTVGRDRDSGGGDHGTQKPVELMARAIRNHRGDVYEPFAGSGTTLIATESLVRRCYAIEIEPRYVEQIINRWEKFTGRKAERVDG